VIVYSDPGDTARYSSRSSGESGTLGNGRRGDSINLINLLKLHLFQSSWTETPKGEDLLYQTSFFCHIWRYQSWTMAEGTIKNLL